MTTNILTQDETRELNILWRKSKSEWLSADEDKRYVELLTKVAKQGRATERPNENPKKQWVPTYNLENPVEIVERWMEEAGLHQAGEVKNRSTDLYDYFCEWVKQMNALPLTASTFGRAMKRLVRHKRYNYGVVYFLNKVIGGIH